MSLREHVRDDDVDAAISVLLTSFINAQKFSVRKSLERGFRKYLTRAGDLFHLLLHALRSLLREAQTYAALKAQQRGTPSSRMVLKVLIEDFEAITSSAPHQSAGWTCLAWLQLLCDQRDAALRSARKAVKLNRQATQSRINLCLALLETKSKGVREHIEFLQRVLMAVPDLQKELKNSIEDGLKRKPNWQALEKINNWLEF